MAEVHSIEIKVDSTQAQTASRNLDKMSGSANGAESALKNLTRAAIGLVALDKLKDAGQAAIKMADAYTEMSSKLRLATGSQEEFNKAQTELFKIAQDNKTALGDTVQLYSRMSVGLKEMGQSQAQTLKMVDAVSKALRISGASTSEASSVITQFGQALGSGVLRGEEFNAVMENGPRLARALADGIGLPIGQLRKLAEQGMLTSDIVVKAIQSQTGALDQEASMLTTTVSQAWTQFENELTQTIGTMNEQSGMTKDLIELMNQLAPLLIEVAKGGMGALSIATDIATKELLGFKGVFGELFDMFPAFLANLDRIKGKTVAEDPEIAKLMKMGQGQATIEEIAGKPAETVEKKAAKANVALASTGKAAKKAADEAQRAFEATINANVKAAEDAAKLYESQSRTQISRLDLELEKAQELARVETKKAQSQEEKIKIAEQLQAKTVEIINAELALRQSVIDKEAEGTQIKMKGIEDELASADRLKLSQAERIQLQSELNSLQTEQSLRSEERTQAELEAQKQILDATKAVTDAGLEGQTSVKEEALRTLEVLSSNLEYTKELATGLAEAFGEIGSAIGGMSIALAEYEKQQATIEIARTEAIDKAKGDQQKIDEANTTAAKKQATAQIKSYGDMTKAAQGFFKKGTAGYEAMGAASKVFRAFEMAQSAMSFAQQLGDMNKLFGSFETMLKEMGILSDINRTKEVVNAQISGNAKAAEGAANQGSSGDPYTAFARVAAWVALMASIGFMVGGGGGSAPAVSPSDIAKQNEDAFKKSTATMLGSSDTSTSILDALEILSANSTNDLDYTKGMAHNMELLVGSIESLSTAISTNFNFDVSKLNLGTVSTPRLKHVGLPADPLMSAIVGGIIGGTKTNRSLIDQGIHIFEQTLGSIIDAGIVKASQYANVLITKTDKALFGMFSSTSQKIERETSKLDPVLKSALGQVLDNAYATLIDAGKFLGKGSEEFANSLKDFTIKEKDLGLGKNAEKNAEKIRAWVSSELDRLVETAVPELKEFQKAGEGLFETSIRVADGVAQAEQELMMLGMTAIKYTDIISDQKDQIDIGTEITRQTILAQADLSEGTRKYVEELKGSAKDVASAYGQIANISATLRGAGFGEIDVDKTMINAAGGLSEFEAAMESFRQNFMTDAQRVNADTVELAQAFGKLGYEMPKSKDEFFKIALGMDKTTEEGKKLFGQFMKLNPAFSDLTDAAKELADAQAEAQQKILDGLQKNVDSAFSTMQKAYQDLQKVQERFLNYSKNIRAYLDELTGGKSAFISPEERYRIAKQEFQRISVLAATGDESALTEITKAGKDFLDASREYNASSQQFQDDFASVTGALEASASYAEAQAFLAENQLRIAESSYSALIAINNSTLGVFSAISALNSTMAAYAAAVASLAAGKITSTPGVITTGSGEVVYNPVAPIGSPTNPIPVARPTLIRPIARAIGGTMPAGVSLVGEYGPELISSGGGYVSTAGATANFFKTIKDAVVITSAEQTALLKEQIGELQALVRLQSAANRELIAQLSEIRNETAESTRIAKVEASA